MPPPPVRSPWLLLLLTAMVVSGEDAEECGPGYQRDPLSGNCIKRFVPPKRKPCPMPEDFANGEFELRGGGRMATFQCNDGWMRVPDNEYAMCKLGVWSRTVPNCVKPGCPALSIPPSSAVTPREEYGGAIVRFACVKTALAMRGEPVLGCDGQRWNGTVPRCVEPPSTTTTKPATEPPSEKMISDGGGGGTDGAAAAIGANALVILASVVAGTMRCF